MLPVIQIGRLALPARPLFFLAALYLGLWLAGREAARRGFDGDALWNAGFLGVAIGLVGGRLAYVFQHWDAYRRDLGAIVSLTPGTIVPGIALVVGVLAGVIYLARLDALRAEMADATALGATLALAILSLGNFFSGDAFGIPTDVPWAITLWGARRHPTQLYEMAALLIVLGGLWALRAHVRPGHLAWVAVLGYGLTRLLLEPLRADPWIWPEGYRGAQILGLLAVLGALWALTRPLDSGEAERAQESG